MKSLVGITFIGRKLGAIGKFCCFRVNLELEPQTSIDELREILSAKYEHIRIIGYGDTPHSKEDPEGQTIDDPWSQPAWIFPKRP